MSQLVKFIRGCALSVCSGLFQQLKCFIDGLAQRQSRSRATPEMRTFSESSDYKSVTRRQDARSQFELDGPVKNSVSGNAIEIHKGCRAVLAESWLRRESGLSGLNGLISHNDIS